MGSLALLSPPLRADRSNRQVRVIGYNVFRCSGWPSNRLLAQQAAKRGHLSRQLADELALYEPDIVAFSESPQADVVKKIAERLGMKHCYFPSKTNWPGALLTRFEFVATKNRPISANINSEGLFTRHWGMAEIRLPDGRHLTVHSAHLRPGTDARIRRREISVMLEAMKNDLRSGKSMLLIGDLNHSPGRPEYQMWKKSGWVDTFAQAGKGRGATLRSDIPRWRVDYIWAAGPIAQQISRSMTLFRGRFRLDINDPTAFALSDHLPLLAVFESS